MLEHERISLSPRELLFSMVKLEIGMFQQALSTHVAMSGENSPPEIKSASEYLNGIRWNGLSQSTLGNKLIICCVHGSSRLHNDTSTGLLLLSPKFKQISIHRAGDFPISEPFNLDLVTVRRSEQFTLSNILVETDFVIYKFPGDG